MSAIWAQTLDAGKDEETTFLMLVGIARHSQSVGAVGGVTWVLVLFVGSMVSRLNFPYPDCDWSFN
jgi:hypothetical protein